MTIKAPRNLIWGWLLVGLGLVLLAGCGTARERYRVLSYFFDGVPDPDAVKRVTNAGDVQVPVVARMVMQHKPYAENQCDACHRSASGEIQEFSEAYKQCVKCHKTVANGHVLMHGPVAREECRWCHAPHESVEPALLKDTPVKVCVQCHDKELLGADPPEHQDGTTSCLQCHFGHGGDGRYFLKPPPPAPASAPGTARSEAPRKGQTVRESTCEGTPIGHAFEAGFAGEATCTIEDAFRNELSLTASKAWHPEGGILRLHNSGNLNGLTAESGRDARVTMGKGVGA